MEYATVSRLLSTSNGILAAAILLLACWPVKSLSSLYECPAGWMLHSSTCYLVLDTAMDWETGLAACRTMGASLLEVNSPAENDFVTDFFGSRDVPGGEERDIFISRSVWLGCSDAATEGAWLCGEDNHPIAFTNWRPGKPGNVSDAADCIHMNCGYAGGWTDFPCNWAFPVMCEKTATSKRSSTLTARRDSAHPGYCLVNHVIREVQSSSLMECAAHCALSNCRSMNFFARPGLCQLNDAEQTDIAARGDFEKTDGCDYIELIA